MCSYQEGGQDPTGDDQHSGMDSHTIYALGTCRASLGNTDLHADNSYGGQGHEEPVRASC